MSTNTFIFASLCLAFVLATAIAVMWFRLD